MDDTPQNDQQSEFERLRAHLNHLHDDLGMTWQEIAWLPDYRAIKISVGKVHGMAVYGDEPKDPVRRFLLGLPPLENCGQCWQFKKYMPEIVRAQARHKARRLDDYPKKTLEVMIKHREKV